MCARGAGSVLSIRRSDKQKIATAFPYRYPLRTHSLRPYYIRLSGYFDAKGYTLHENEHANKLF